MERHIHWHKFMLEHTCILIQLQTCTADLPGLILSLFPQLSRCFPPLLLSLSLCFSVYPADELVVSQHGDRDETFFSARVPPLCLSFNYTGRTGNRTVIRWWALPRSLALSPLCEWEAVQYVFVCVCLSSPILLSLWGPNVFITMVSQKNI